MSQRADLTWPQSMCAEIIISYVILATESDEHDSALSFRQTIILAATRFLLALVLWDNEICLLLLT